MFQGSFSSISFLGLWFPEFIPNYSLIGSNSPNFTSTLISYYWPQTIPIPLSLKIPTNPKIYKKKFQKIFNHPPLLQKWLRRVKISKNNFTIIAIKFPRGAVVSPEGCYSFPSIPVWRPAKVCPTFSDAPVRSWFARVLVSQYQRWLVNLKCLIAVSRRPEASVCDICSG